MSDEIFLDGKRFVSSVDAGQSVGVTHDYVSRLCRQGKVPGKQIGKNWYVELDALRSFLDRGIPQKTGTREFPVTPKVIEPRQIPIQKKETAGYARPSVPEQQNKSAALRSSMAAALAERGVHTMRHATRLMNSPAGAAHAALGVAHIPAQSLTPAVDFLHRLTALALAVMLTFGTYALVDPHAIRFAQESIRNNAKAVAAAYQGVSDVSTSAQNGIALAARHPDVALASAATAVPNMFGRIARGINSHVNEFVYTIAFPSELVRSLARIDKSQQGSLTVAVTQQSAPANNATHPSGALSYSQTIVNQPVIERVTEVQRIVAVGGLTEDILDRKLQELDNKLSSRMYALSSANSTSIADTYHVVSQTNRIDNLGSVDIGNSTITDSDISGGTIRNAKITGGSISGVAISLDSLSVGSAPEATLSFDPEAQTFVVDGTSDFSFNASSSVFSLSGTGGSLTYTGTSSVLRLDGNLEVTGSATFGSFILDTASTTNLIAINSTTTNATTTNLFAENLRATNFNPDNLTVINATATNLFAANASTTNATSTNLFAVLGRFTSGIIDTLTATVASITNLTAINATTTNATTTNLYASGRVQFDSDTLFANATSTNFFSTTASSTDLFATNLTAGQVLLGNATTSVLYSTVASSTNLFATAAQFGTLAASALTLTNATATNFFATNASTTNATSTNLFSVLGRFTTGIIDALTATVATITNLTATNATTTNATTTNLYASGQVQLAGNTTLANATSTNFFSTTASSTNLFASNLTAGTVLLGNATTSVLYSTTASSTNLFATAAQFGSLAASSLTLTNALSVANGGTGATSFGQGWIYSDGGTNALAASTSPTVNYITATSSTATSTFGTGGFIVGTNRFVVQQSTGRIGIGTNAPTTGLDIDVPVDISGDFTVSGGSAFTFTATGPINQTGVGQVTFGGNVDAANGLDVTNANLTVGTNKFVVIPASGNTAIAGTLGVTGAVAASSTLGVTGASRFYSTLRVDNTLTAAGSGTGLSVTNDASIGGALNLTGAAAFGSSLSVTGTLSAATTTISGELSVSDNKITGVRSPTDAQDAANKSYVDSVAQGLDLKDAVKAATVSNITLSGEQTVDGVSLVAGDRILVKDQSDETKNGIYTVAVGSWSRSGDADEDAEVGAGMFTFVQEGTVNANSGWVMTTSGTITLGSSTLDFTQFSGAGQIVAGTGMTKSGNTLNVSGTADRITANADSIDIASTYVGQSSITTVGALTSGSLAPGFGNIDIGASTITGGAATFSSIIGSAITGSGNMTINGTGSFTSDLSVSGTLNAATTTLSGNLAMGGKKITGLANPTSAQEAATKAYVDAIAQGLTVKAAVRAASTGNITLSGEQTVDGISLVTGDRILVKNQSAASENGIYAVDSGSWSRATDADENSEVTTGMYVFIQEGSTQANTGWSLITLPTITLGSTSLTFTQFSGTADITAGDGLTKTGNTIDVVGTTDRISVTADAIDIASTYAGQNSITTVGALTSGSIGGGFGAINIGSAALTAGGALFSSVSSIGSVSIGGTSTTTIQGNGATSTFSGGISLTSGNINLPSSGSILSNNSNILSATALGASVVSSSLTSVGAVDGGSITSGFGPINIGADTLDAGNTTLANATTTSLFTTTLHSITASTSALIVSGVNGLMQGNGNSAVTGITGTAGQFPYYNGTNTLLATSSIFLAANGKFGVGSTSPFAKLSVKGSGTGTGIAFQTTDSSNNPLLTVLDNGHVGFGTGAPTYLWQAHTTSGQTDVAITTDVDLGSANTTQLAFVSDLDGTPSYASIGQFNTAGLRLSGAGNLVSPSMIITDTGNVGIGTTSPTNRLEVAGNTFLGGNLTATGTLAVTGAATLSSTLGISGAITSTAGNANILPYASSTAITSSILYSTTASTTNLTVSGIQSALVLTNSSGVAAAYSGTGTCSNQFVRSINGSGVATCASITNADITNGTIDLTTKVTGILPIANGGTNASSFGTSNGVTYYDGTRLVNSTGLTFDGTKLTATYASSTAISISGTAYFPGSSVWNSSGLGVGTTSPAAKLDVYNTSSGATADQAYFTNAASATSTGSRISFRQLDVTGAGTTTSAIASILQQNYTAGKGDLAFSTLRSGLLTEAMRITSTGSVGIGTTSPQAKLEVVNTSSGATADQLYLSNLASATSTATRLTFRANDLFNATSTAAITSILQQNFNGGAGDLAFSVLTAGTLTEGARLSNAGKFGVGTTTPYARLAVSQSASVAQFAVGYDAANDFEARVDAAGDTSLESSGGDFYMNNDNLWVCTGGSITSNGCPSGAPATKGNLIVETGIGVGTTTPQTAVSALGTITAYAGNLNGAGNPGSIQLAGVGSTPTSSRLQFGTDGSGWKFAISKNQAGTVTDFVTINDSGNVGIGTTTPGNNGSQLAVQGKLYVANGGVTTLGMATSTFQGDIKIQGKLDVSTIDPVYTIDGTKYATYGHSTVGIKEEMMATIQVSEKDASGKYVSRIAFDHLDMGSDLWLFYQITDFGTNWENLVVTLTPAFDGKAYYTKVPGENALILSADQPGEVSLRLSANRFDWSKWPNLRPDQDADFTHFRLESKK